MSCSGPGYGKKSQSNNYLTSQFTSIDQTNTTTTKKCRGYTGFYPSFTPVLSSLSVTTSSSGSYSLVYVTGSNFLPNGTTYINFGSFGNLSVTYYSSNNLSFVVPQNALAGNYNVQAVNIYNGNFSPQVSQSYPGNPNYSNSITYTIT